MQNSIWVKGAGRNKTGMQKERKETIIGQHCRLICMRAAVGLTNTRTQSRTNTLGTKGALSLRLPVWCWATNSSTQSSTAGEQAREASPPAGSPGSLGDWMSNQSDKVRY